MKAKSNDLNGADYPRSFAAPPSETLFDQLDEAERGAVACLIGADRQSSNFECILRHTPAIPAPFCMGDAARAYLVGRLAYLHMISLRSESEMRRALNECAFAIESFAHLQGREQELLPIAERARAAAGR